MQIRQYITILLVSISSFQLALQAQYYHWDKIGVQDGLISANVYTVFESQRAFLWVGTDQGISRYDGFQFKNFSAAGDQRIGQVNDFVEDAAGSLWAGSSLGLFYWNKHQFHSLEEAPTGIKCLSFDLDGNLWVGTNKGIFFYASHALEEWKKHKTSPKPEHKPIPDLFQDDPRITNFHLGQEGVLYASTYYCVLRWDGKKWESIWGSPQAKPDIMAIAEINPGTLLFANETSRFQLWEKGEVTELPESPYRGLDVAMHKGSQYMLTYDELAKKDHTGWQRLINSDETGIEWMRAFCFDRHDNIWVATFEGLIKVQPAVFRHFPPQLYPSLKEVYAIGESPQKDLLFGGNRGQVFRLDENGVQPHFSDHQQLVPNAEIFAIHTAKDQSVWFGTGYQGIVRAEGAKITSLGTADGLSDDARFFFYEAPNGTFWTGGDGSIDQITVTEQQVRFKGYHLSLKAHYAVFKNAAMDQHNNLWIASDYGLFQLKDGQLKIVRPLNFEDENLSLNDIIIDADNHMWLATNGSGIVECTIEASGTPVFLNQYSRKTGLASDAYLQLIIDFEGQLWASSYVGICRIGKGTPSRCYDAADGFLDKTFTNLCLFQSSDSLIWAGSSEGVVSFSPRQIIPNQAPPVLEISAVLLFDGEEDITRYQQQATPEQLQLILPYYQNNLSFSYTGVNLSRPDKTIFKYRLIGLDPQWTSTSYTEKISYPKLAPGHYQFELLAGNEDGVWSAPLHYAFEVCPPFWMSWWFATLIILSLITGVWLVFKEQQRRNRIKQQLIETKLQALQAQMNPHFLSNALNAINYFILENNAFSASRYLTKFSRLIRSILHNSQEVTITLAKEIEALQLYLELEKLRFEDRFDFAIHIEEDSMLHLIQIPPLLIQPFAENAILHGFQNKDKPGLLQINIYQTNGLLKCDITDNGIGRKAARERQQHRGKKAGQGQQITANRLQLLSQRAESIIITDLYDEQGQASGTQVEISLPAVYHIGA